MSNEYYKDVIDAPVTTNTGSKPSPPPGPVVVGTGQQVVPPPPITKPRSKVWVVFVVIALIVVVALIGWLISRTS